MIEATRFGQITISGRVYEHDVVVRSSGKVRKRKKKLSKKVYGTSHIVSLDEVRKIYEVDVPLVVIGTGQYGCLDLSEEARAYLEAEGVRIELAPTPEAIGILNSAPDPKIGIFHVTC